jgi:hypothetical protein
MRHAFTLAAHLLLVSHAALHAADAPRKLNVLVVIADDQGYGELSCHGNPVLKTPHLDRLYADSKRMVPTNLGRPRMRMNPSSHSRSP